MIKTIKGKVVAGTVAVTLFAGAGAAFGYSDAGTNLQNWYKAKFTQNQVAVVGETGIYSGLKLAGLSAENIRHKLDSTTKINNTRNTAILDSTTKINSESQEHINAVNSQRGEIMGGIATQFDQLSENATALMEKAGEETSKLLIADLQRHTDGVGGAAVAKVGGDLATVKTAAVSNLQTAIANAKSDILAELAKEKNLTIKEIKAMIDQKIVELRRLITESKDGMITAQQNLIKEKATELELEATTEMDALVDGI
jgi:uncharacterized protein YdbL (DUF1318 family)